MRQRKGACYMACCLCIGRSVPSSTKGTASSAPSSPGPTGQQRQSASALLSIRTPRPRLLCPSGRACCTWNVPYEMRSMQVISVRKPLSAAGLPSGSDAHQRRT